MEGEGSREWSCERFGERMRMGEPARGVDVAEESGED